jgi:hypothetical protein
VQVSTAAQNRPQGRDAAELTISQLQGHRRRRPPHRLKKSFSNLSGVALWSKCEFCTKLFD